MFDLEKAYGLGLIISEIADNVRVFDKGSYYQIDSSDSLREIKSNLDKILSLVAESIETWGDVLRTTKGEKNRLNKIKKIKQILKTSSKEIIEKFRSFQTQINKIGSKERLTPPLELSAFKGFRDPIRGQRYIEGSDFEVPEDEWALAIIGALHFTIWKAISKSEFVAILPCPDSEKGIEVSENTAKTISSILKEKKGISRVSVLSFVAHFAVWLYKELLRKRQTKPDGPIDSFSKFIYGSLAGTAQQSKPKTGGYFSLELLRIYLLINKEANFLIYLIRSFGLEIDKV